MEEEELLQELFDKIKELETEIEELKSYKEAYKNIISEIRNVEYQDTDVSDIIEIIERCETNLWFKH